MIKKNGIGMAEAVLSLHPNASFSTRGAGTIDESEELTVWRSEPDIPCPTTEELEAEQTRLLGIYDTQEYVRQRKSEYPSIEECVHAILDDDLTALQEKRQAVKTKYPKPTD